MCVQHPPFMPVSHWHGGWLQVIAEFRRHSAEADPARRARNLQLARDYNFLLQSVREHKVMLEYTVISRPALSTMMPEV